MFQRILVALKFGTAGIDALKRGAELARFSSAELHIFHALDYTLKDTDETAPELVAIKKKTESQYRAEIEPLTAGLTSVTFKCRPADPALEVCKLARNLPADLIVLGCHQLSEKISMGRLDYVGITILEKAPCPVMLVPYLKSS
jgi:nucleotide-binding universal stress UspA family protein